ncbi:MAG: hypothetical protein ABSC06_02890 [Rhodopila sp.]|jgi:hypothetical protein
MSNETLSPESVMRQMKQNGVDVVWLPDRETDSLYLLMQADPDLRLVGVTREPLYIRLKVPLSWNYGKVNSYRGFGGARPGITTRYIPLAGASRSRRNTRRSDR